MNRSIRLSIHRWLALFAVVALVIGLFAAAPQPSAAQVHRCMLEEVISLKVGTYSDDELNDATLFNSLTDAIAVANEQLSVCNDRTKHATIHLTESARNLKLPNEIGYANYGTIIVTGHNKAGPIVGQTNQHVQAVTSVSFSNVKFEIESAFFNPHSFFSCYKCEVEGRGKDAIFIDSDKEAYKGSHLLLKDGRYRNVWVLRGSLNYDTIEVSGNEMVNDNSGPERFLSIAGIERQLGTAAISNNTFHYTGNEEDYDMIRVYRPNVTIDHNQFIADDPDVGTGIAIYPIWNQYPGMMYLPVKDVNIAMNSFRLRRSISSAERESAWPKEFGFEATFQYNDFSNAQETLPKQHTTINTDKVYGPCNYWGDLDKRKNVKANRASMDRYLTAPPTKVGEGCTSGQQPQPQPQPEPKPGPSDVGPAGKLRVERVSGPSRVETAVEISRKDFKTGADTVIVARADNFADSVSVIPLADELDAPVLVTQTDRLHPVVAEELKRLKPKQVIIMGGPVAIDVATEQAIASIVPKVERIAGNNRADTAVGVADRLAKQDTIKRVLVADGTDWQASLVSSPAAAEADGVVLLTNGGQMAPETKAFLDRHASITPTAVGANAATALPGKQAVMGDSASHLSVMVAKAFFAKPKAMGVATTADFADALTGGAHIARKDGPLFLLTDQNPSFVKEWMKAQPALEQVYVYGGETRITDQQVADLIK